MEHRHSHRINAHLPIRLCTHDKAVITGVTRNLSRDGLFVEVNRCPLRKNQPLQVEIMDKHCAWRSFGVIVTHHGEHGAGLEFVNDYDEIDKLLVELAQH